MTDAGSPSPAEAQPPLDRWVLRAAFAAAVALSVFQLWQSVTADLAAIYFRSAHLVWVIVLTIMLKPLVKRTDSPWHLPGRAIDVVLALAALYCGWAAWTFDYDAMGFMLEGLGTPDLVAGALMILLVLEATRRTVGPAMTLIGLGFLLYARFGNALPDAVAHRGFDLGRIVELQMFSLEGIFGTPLGVAAGVVFMFVLLGALLEVTGAGNFFIDLAYAAAGRYRGGPAKASVIASAAMGSISGSAVANTVTTGAFTIPMMKRLGYQPHQAAGIEAAASTGGQIMPPIMGAGAFLMAEYTGISYGEIVLVSILPAVLYFVSVLLFVHLMACRQGLKGMTDLPRVRVTLAGGYHFLIPLIVITVLLVMNYSPPLVGTIGCGAAVGAALLRVHTRVGFGAILKGLETGAMLALPISLACATAGIVVGVIGQTGIGLKFSDFIVTLSGGHLWLALILIALASLVLGMGLPVTAAYIVVAVLSAPALTDMGLSLLVAHMIVFWLSQDSNVTPPIALAAYAGAGVAGASPMRSGLTAWKVAKGLYIIPLMMAYTDLLTGDTVMMAWATLLTLAALISFSCAIEGWIFVPTSLVERVLLAVAGPFFLFRHPAIDIAGEPISIPSLIGLVLLALALMSNRRRMLRA